MKNCFVKCIENGAGNTNFVKDKIYEVKENKIDSEWLPILLHDISIENQEFDFAVCKFRIVERVVTYR